MTLEQMKENVYTLIEEYNEDNDDLTDDTDFASKINSVINHIQNELSRFKKIPSYITKEVKKGEVLSLKSIDKNIYQLNIIKDVDYELLGEDILFNDEGLARIYYYKYPNQINSNTSDNFKIDLPSDVLEIMPYGVAGDLLKSDVSSQYGNVYSKRYEELKQNLDPRYSLGSIYIEGGIDV